MPDQKDPLGILGDSTTKKKDPLGILSEEPSKKKAQSGIGGKASAIGSQVGGLETPSTGLKADSGFAGKIAKQVATQPVSKPAEFKPEMSIGEYNKSLRSTLGLPELELGSDLPQIQKAREQKEYKELRDIYEKDYKPTVEEFEKKLFTGQVQPKQLQELTTKPYGKRLLNDILRESAPELGSVSDGFEALQDEAVAEQTALTLQTKFRRPALDAYNQQQFNLDKEVYDELKGLKRVDEFFGGGTGGGSYSKSEINAPEINTNSPEDLGKILSFLQGGDTSYFEVGGKRLDKKQIEDLAAKINEKMLTIKAAEPIHPELLQDNFSGKLANAINNVSAEWKNDPKLDPQKKLEFTLRDAKYAELGMNFLRDANKAAYNNIFRTVTKNETIADTDYEQLISIGKRIENQRAFTGGDFVLDDDRDFRTYQTMKANESLLLSEKIKEAGFTPGLLSGKVPDYLIVAAAKDLGLDPDSQRIADIRKDEAAGGYGIVKGGKVQALKRGLAAPIKSIQTTFDALFSDPATAYLNSKRYDYGDQVVPDQYGNYSDVLPGERNNILNKIIEGTGQFTTQLLTSYLGGRLLSTPYNAIAKTPLTKPQMINVAAYGGGGLSTALQTYGQSYLDFLDKTGDPNKASLMATIDGLAQSVIEVGVLPDVKLFEGAKEAFKSAKNNLAKNIIKVIENGGGAEAAKPFIVNFLKESGKIWGKEVIGEEVTQNATNYLVEAIFSPKTAEKRNLSEETKQVIKDASLAMTVPIILRGVGAGKAGKKFGKESLHIASQNFDEIADGIEEARNSGLVKPEEADRALNILKTHKESINNAPKVDANGELINAERQLEYAYQNTVVESLKQEAAKKDDIQKEPLLKRIEEANEIKRQIFNGKESKEIPPKEEPKIDQDRVLGDEEVVVDEDFISKPIELDPNLPEGYVLPTTQLTPEQQIIQQAIDNNEVEGMFLDMAKAAVADPQQAKQLLDEAKSQATGQVAGELGSARSGVEKAWGKTIADFVAPQETPTPKTGKGEGDWSRDVESTAKALREKEKTNEDEVFNLEGDANVYINKIVGEKVFNIIENLPFSDTVKKEIRKHFSISEKGEFRSSLGIDKIIKSNDIERTKKFIKNIGAEILREKYGESSTEYSIELDKLYASVDDYIQSLLDAEESGRPPKINKNISQVAQILYYVQDAYQQSEKEIPNNLSEAYHKAKADGTNPELVKAVEDLLGKPTQEPTPPTTQPKSEGNKVDEGMVAELESQREAEILKEGKPKVDIVGLKDEEFAKLSAAKQNEYEEWEKEEINLRKLIDCLWKK